MNLRANPSRRVAAPVFIGVPLAVALVILPVPAARAGVVSDTIRVVADWVSEVESSVNGWLSQTWADIKIPDRAEAAATAVRRKALENPAQLATMADQVGFKLIEYRIDQREQRVVVLEFAYDRVVDNETRLSLWRRFCKSRTRRCAPSSN